MLYPLIMMRTRRTVIIKDVGIRLCYISFNYDEDKKNSNNNNNFFFFFGLKGNTIKKE